MLSQSQTGLATETIHVSLTLQINPNWGMPAKSMEKFMKRFAMYLLFAIIPQTALAAEKMKGTDFFVVDQSSWETSANAGYWIWHGKGVSQPHVGPFESETIDCHGAGFFDKDDSWGEGICIHGEGADTRTSSWKREKGKKMGQWKILSGTGKHQGTTGQGTYIPTTLVGDYHVSEIEGEVTIGQ
jgi:hypothetical protein